MNKETSKLYDIILNDDRIFLAVIDSDDPDQVREVIRKFDRSFDINDTINFNEVQWKELYNTIKDLDDPVDILNTDHIDSYVNPEDLI